MQGDQEDEILSWTVAISLNQHDAMAYCMRGKALHNVGRNEEAIQDFTKAIQLNSKNEEAYLSRGNVLYDLERNEEAIQEFTKAITLNPKNEEAYFGRANALYRLKRNQEAIQDFTKAIQFNPNNEEAFQGRANALHNLGRNEEAIEDVSKVIKLNSKNNSAYFNRGLELNKQGRKEEALRDYLKALELQPNNPLYLSELGNFYYIAKEKLKATQYFSQAEEQLNLLTEETKEELQLTEGHIHYIRQKIQLIGKIDVEIEKAERLVRSNTLSSQQQQILKKELDEKKKQLDQEIMKPATAVSNIGRMSLLFNEIRKLQEQDANKQQQINQQKQQIDELKQGQILQQNDLKQVLSQDFIVIKNQLDQLQQNKSQFFYYRSVFWRVQSYLQACIQISTDLFLNNNDAIIETTNEKVVQAVTKVGKAAADNLAIPFLSSAFNIIDSALEFYKKRKFKERVQRLVNLIKIKAQGQSELEIEIKFGVISLAKLLPDYLEEPKNSKNIFQYVQSILLIDYNGGIKEANDPYWIQGISDSILILHYLEDNNGAIQDDSEAKLRDVIVEGAQQNLQNIVETIQPNQPVEKESKGCLTLCQIQ